VKPPRWAAAWAASVAARRLCRVVGHKRITRMRAERPEGSPAYVVGTVGVYCARCRRWL
jgi:hypothetical protein